jgi:ATP-dependent RNA helicase DeaD
LPPPAREALSRVGWTSLMPVQARTIPYVMAGRDLMVQARTGSGKTGAFLLPTMGMLDPAKPVCQAMILVPTRELAQQVYGQAHLLAQPSGLRTIAVYGGVGYKPQLDAFRDGAHIVVGTPGRILDHLMRGTLVLDHLRILVFDEADRLMSMGFYPDMRQIGRYVPQRRQGYMFSATFTNAVIGLAGEFLHKPEFLSLSRDRVHIAEMSHVWFEVPAMEKDRALVRIIEIENPSAAIVFCNTKDRVNYVNTVLQRFGYDADMLTADLSQSAREQVLDRLRTGKLRFLVATDVAARGIDVPDITHVFLYEFPDDAESYIHRAGRTARAGGTGTAISLVSLAEAAQLAFVARQYGVDMEKRTLPTDADVQEIVAERVIALLEARLRNRDRLHNERMRRFVPLARSLSDSDDELDVVAMLLDDFYQETLHAPPEAPKPPARVQQRRSSERGDRGERGDRNEGGEGGGGGRRRSPRRRGGRT